MNIDFLVEYFAPVIVGLCICIGYLIKTATPIDNKYIPVICGGLGVVFAYWLNFPIITPEIILTGLFSGLAATGLFEAFRNLIEKK